MYREKLLEDKTQFLTQSYARFQWVASFKLDNKDTFKILFDATDIPQGDAVSGIFIENSARSEFILSIIKKYSNNISPEKRNLQQSFIASLMKYLKKPALDYFSHLDNTFGELRAPKYLKDSEYSGGEIFTNNSRKVYYESNPNLLDEIYPNITVGEYLIWAISGDGGLIIGENTGHPTLTGFKPARIAGELKKQDGIWFINSKSGRYSKDYHNPNIFLENALNRFKSVFPCSKDVLTIETNPT